MVVTSQEATCENEVDRHPLLMGGEQNHVQPSEEGGQSSGAQVRSNQSSSSSSSGSNSPVPSITTRRHNEPSPLQWSPHNWPLWFRVESVFAMIQIIASLVVLYVSRHQKPQAPLFTWIVGYAVGCAASILVLQWRIVNHNQGADRQNTSSQVTSEVISIDEPGPPNARLDRVRMALNCFFAIWFVVGNVWIFRGRASASQAPYLYRLCVVLLTINCIGYGLPIILFALLCFWSPCISPSPNRENLSRGRGAPAYSINALPAYRLELGTVGNVRSRGHSGSEGGALGTGTESKRIVPWGKDFECCICLTKYVHHDVLRELPCSHFFHRHCVDEWLRTDGTCPLCKLVIGGGTNGASQSGENSNQQM